MKLKPFFFYLFFILIYFLTPGDSNCLQAKSRYEPNIDSLRQLVDTCTSDSRKFKILSDYFWKNSENIDHFKPIGNWAYEVIKGSDNKASLSYGMLIKGVICKSERNYDSAMVYLNNALQLSENRGDKNLEAISCMYLGEIEIYNGNLDTSLLNMKRAYKLFKDLNKNKDAALRLNDIAAIYERKGMPDSAVQYHNQILDYYKSISDTLMMAYANIGISYFYKRCNDAKQSIAFLNEAMRLSETNSDPEASLIVNLTIGKFFAEQKRNYPIALNIFHKILDSKKSAKNLNDQTFLYNYIGNIYREQNNDSLAVLYHQKSLEVANEMGHRHYKSNAWQNLGLDYQKMGDYCSALNCFRIAYETGCQECPVISFHESLLSMSDIYLLLNQPDSAIYWYNESLRMAEKFHGNKEIGLSQSSIGDFYLRKGKLALAEEHYLKSLPYSTSAGNLSLIASVADSLNSIYTKTGDYSKANHYLRLSRDMTDSLYKIEKQSDLTEFAVKLEYENIKNESRLREDKANAEIEKQKMFRDFLLVITVLLVGFGMLIFLNYRRKKADYKLLCDKSKVIEEKNNEIQTQVNEITKQKVEIERISGELHEADAMKLRFFSNISHEFRTPLTLIINPLQKILKEKSEENEHMKQLEKIFKNAQRLLDLTNQILDLQKLDAGKLQLNLEKGDLVKYCLGLVSSFESACDLKDNRIRFYADHRSAITWFDKDKTGKILFNLLSNTLKFCYEGTQIDIQLRFNENTFQLIITDQGIGIPHEQLEHIFKRYYQVPSAKQATGTGIGLAYVKELTEFLGGEISIRSEVGEGTIICVSLPLKELEIPDRERFTELFPNQKESLLPTKEFNTTDYLRANQYKNSILIVEDNDELREFIASLFKAEFNVYLATNGEEGANVAFQSLPDIIVSDVMMPLKDGFELCSQLKNDERTSHIPVILLTAKDTPQSSLEGYQTGADDYIIKPFENELLILKVRNVIATHDAKRKQFDFESISSIEEFNLGNTDKEFIKKCIGIIQKNIDDSSFSVEKLADELAFSKRNFYRKMIALINLTPAELIRVYRLQFARQLLQKGNIKVFEVASLVGYEDVNSFRLAFKKQFGIPPSEINCNKGD